MSKDTLTKTGLSKAADEFVNQYTRQLMVDWCVVVVQNGTLRLPRNIFVQYALDKKWISLVSPDIPEATYKVLSPGFETAARFLKR